MDKEKSMSELSLSLCNERIPSREHRVIITTISFIELLWTETHNEFSVN